MRLVIISNRLPTIVAWEDGRLQTRETAGGLVSGLRAWLDRQRDAAGGKSRYVWIGWPGASVPEKQQRNVEDLLASAHAAVPVFLPQAVMDKFYLGFCNRTIWPLFHYFPSLVGFEPDHWQKYCDVNQTFMETVRRVLLPGDRVWIHDYHLMLLPALIRREFPDLEVGFFLHIPFPSFEIFRQLPSRWRAQILEGLLGADVVGFHTHDYCQHFVKCARRILGCESYLGNITHLDRVVRAETFPMGIDADLYAGLAGSPEVIEARDALASGLEGQRVIVSIDRLDYSKGIPHRLRGFARFLERYPEWRGKVCLAMVVVPSRIGVDQYQLMKRQIDELVGSINGRFGDVQWTPIRYQYRMLAQESLSALYAAGDVGLVTPLRDGMNLVAKEYVASRREKKGVLILSEMAGAARELGEALIVNPNSPDEIADALQQALSMEPQDQAARLDAMQDRIHRHDVSWWAQDFLRTLADVHGDQRRYRHLPLSEEAFLTAFDAARRRLILLDYDGTLVPFHPRPEQAAPGAALMRILERLSEDPDSRVVIVSGRSRDSLQRWFAGLPVEVAAEHGALLRDPEGLWRPLTPLQSHWKAQLLPILQASAERLPGAFVEEKEYALVWHYRSADPELGTHRAAELQDTLTSLVANLDVQVLPGNRVIEVRNASVHKGAVASRMLDLDTFDFVMAAGDDWTDEDMFRALPDEAWSIKVGSGASRARFSIPTQDALVALLGRMGERVRPREPAGRTT